MSNVDDEVPYEPQAFWDDPMRKVPELRVLEEARRIQERWFMTSIEYEGMCTALCRSYARLKIPTASNMCVLLRTAFEELLGERWEVYSAFDAFNIGYLKSMPPPATQEGQRARIEKWDQLIAAMKARGGG